MRKKLELKVPKSSLLHPTVGRYEYQVNLHFSNTHLSGYNVEKGAIFATSLGALLRRIVMKHGLKTEQILFSFQPE